MKNDLPTLKNDLLISSLKNVLFSNNLSDSLSWYNPNNIKQKISMYAIAKIK